MYVQVYRCGTTSKQLTIQLMSIASAVLERLAVHAGRGTLAVSISLFL